MNTTTQQMGNGLIIEKTQNKSLRIIFLKDLLECVQEKLKNGRKNNESITGIS